jgi:mRNA interferase MazF
MTYERGDVVKVSLSPVIGSEQADIRPAVIISNDLFHRLNIVTVAAITSRIIRSPGRVSLEPDSGNGLDKPSDVLAYQVRTIATDPKRILKKLGRISQRDMHRVEEALKIALKLS